jgi:hypothetical protein
VLFYSFSKIVNVFEETVQDGKNRMEIRVEKTHTVTPIFMGREAGQFLEKKTLDAELAVFLKESSSYKWNEDSKVTGKKTEIY